MSGTMILPGVYIDVLSEGLIAPGQVTVGNLGVVGTAAKGPVGQPVLLGTFNDALAAFGSYDSFTDPLDPTTLRANSLTLTRALEQAFASGASTVYAMRVAAAGAGGVAPAAATLASAAGPCVTLTAASPGTWGNAMTVNVTSPAAGDVLTVQAVVTLTAAQAAAQQITLKHNTVASLRNRVIIRKLDGSTSAPNIVTAAPGAGQAEFSGANLIFGDPLAAGDIVTVGYAVDPAAFVNVTLSFATVKEVYLVTDGDMLVTKANDPQSGSTLVTATAAANSSQLPSVQVLPLTGGQKW